MSCFAHSEKVVKKKGVVVVRLSLNTAPILYIEHVRMTGGFGFVGVKTAVASVLPVDPVSVRCVKT